MFKNSLSDVFPVLHRIYDLTELILVGSNISDWLNILQKSDVEKVYYINQASLDYRFETLPPNWEVTTKLLAQENGEITHYTLTNSMLNGTVDSKVLAKLWKNLETLTSTQKEALSLKTYIESKCKPNSSKMLVVDSFDGLQILTDLRKLDINAVAIRVIASDEDEFSFASQVKVNQKMTEWGYKHIATYTDNHPKIKTVVYVKNTQLQIKQLNEIIIQSKNKIEALTKTEGLKEQENLMLQTEIENRTKELTTQLEQKKQKLSEAQKGITELQNTKLALENRIKELTTQLEQEKQKSSKIQNENEELIGEKQELKYRNQKFNEQVVKFEAQLELIQKLLIKNKVIKK